MKKVLVLADYYLPGFKAGGPLHSLHNLIETMGEDSFTFYVVTRDRDLTDKEPYKDVKTHRWMPLGSAHVFYTRKPSFTILLSTIRELNPDVIYMNSFFSRFTFKILLLRRLRLLPPAAMVLAPRGEFSPGALALKRGQKRAFLMLTSRIGLHRNLLWHASTEREKREIQNVLARFSKNKRGHIAPRIPIHVASDMPGQIDGRPGWRRGVRKRPGEVSFVFVSRLSPMKNLLAAIQMVSGLSCEVSLDIYGPVDDQAYFLRCRQAAAQLPLNVKVCFKGALPHDEAQAKFAEYHFFLFPTLGENFGHVIVEALSAGCPVITSTETPWSGLQQKGVGWDLPLRDRGAWHEALQHCGEMKDDEYQGMSKAAANFVREWLASSRIKEANVALFMRSLSARTDEPEQGTGSDSSRQSSKVLSY